MSKRFALPLVLLILGCLAVPRAVAQPARGDPAAAVFGAKELKDMGKDAFNLVEDAGGAGGGAVEVVKPFNVENYQPLSQIVKPGWYRLRIRVKPAAGPGGLLAFSLWNPPDSPGHFRYQTAFESQEFPAAGQWGELTRLVQVGPMNAQYGMSLIGGWPGLRIEYLKLEPARVEVRLLQVRPDKLVYKLGEAGTVAVTVQNGTGTAQTAHLTVEALGGLDDSTRVYDQDVTVPAPKAGAPFVVSAPLPAQAEFGHGIAVTLKYRSVVCGTMREYFYTTDHPVRIGHLGAMGFADAYTAEEARPFVEHMRQHYFPMYELLFWAPDDVVMLAPPPGQDRWWSGQTLARVSTQSMQQRVKLGHDLGMKVLGYTDLRYDYGFRIADYFRRYPEACDWDANNADLAYGVGSQARQARQDDSDRFDEKNQPRFNAAGIWGLMTGNPMVVGHHVGQLLAAAKLYDLDGYRYDDRYDYDAPGVDMLGRQMPAPEWANPAIVGKLRRELEKARPGSIYGHNMEWDQSLRSDGPPMGIEAKPFTGDRYSEFVRDDGLHLQERWTAYMVGNHAPWKEVAENLFRTGFNAYRWGGHAYCISTINNARPVDGKYLTALHLAGYCHIAYDVSDEQVGYMSLACRHCDLLFGENLAPILEPANVLSVDAGQKEIWWQRYVRVRQIAPGRRVYLVHLINPPKSPKIGEGDGTAPDALTSVKLRWTLPAGWKATKAWHLAGEGGREVANIAGVDRVGYDLVQQPLDLHPQGAAVEVTLPRLQIWSIVALDCEGPKDDMPPPVKLELPPVPQPPAPREPALVKGDNSPNGLRPLVYDSSANWADGGDKEHKPLPLVADAEAGGGQAVRLSGPITCERYSSGEAIKGGAYRITLRLKSLLLPPKDAKIEISAWCPGNRPNAWRVHEVIPLRDLTPAKGWQTVKFDVEMGYGWENFGVQFLGGSDGLLVDYLKIEEVRRAPEAKQMQLRNLKGWPEGQALIKHDGLRIWHGQGLYHQYFGLTEAMKKIPGVSVVEATHYVYRNQRGFEGAGWKSPQDLASYDLVVLNNIDLKTFDLEARDWLRGYVQAGGSLWLIGGPYGLGRGYWQESDLLENLLPVKMHAYDLRPDGRDEPLALRPVKGEIVPDDAWPQNPVTVWVHEVELKSGAKAHVLAGKWPALATWQVGRGRVAALMVTPLGDAPEASLPWWNWPPWPALMTNTTQWLLKR